MTATRKLDRRVDSLRAAAILVVALHLAIGAVHGAAHLGIPVPNTVGQNVIVALVVTAAPLVGLWGVLRGMRIGVWVLLLAMIGSLAFGIVNHFVVVSPDHVGQIPAGTWQLPFQATSWALAISEATGVLIALALLRR